ncbi:MAG: hypothetical protein ABIA93_02715 [Candidatus Woesearchaeota archaeon]
MIVKKIIPLFLVLVLTTFANAATLSDFPSIFVEKGWELQANFVVGERASSSDVLLGVDLATRLSQWVSQENENRPLDNQMEYDRKGISKTADMDDLGDNYFAIGLPCKNKIVSKLLNTTSCSAFKTGDGYLALFISNETKIIVITGGDYAGMEKAKNVLYNFEEYNLNSENILIRESNPYVLIDMKFKSTNETEDIVLNETDETSVSEDSQIKKEGCSGCLVSGVCYSIGSISNGTYCSSAGDFEPQIGEGEACGSSYQCTIPLMCIQNVCEKPEAPEMKSEGFFQAIANFFKRLFGKS